MIYYIGSTMTEGVITTIVLEGPDGSGKTSLANKLSIDLKLEIAPKAVTPDTERTVDLTYYVDDHIGRGFQPVIFDRLALFSEPIYAAAMARPMRDGFDNLSWYISAFEQFRLAQPLVIICLPRFETLWNNVQRDQYNNRLFPKKEKVYRVYVQYQFLLAQHPEYMHYDYEDDPYSAVQGLVKSMVGARV